MGGNASRSCVFTDENHQGARQLYADTLEQLAFGSETATWRNFFLAGATELRDGNFGTPTTTSTTMAAQLSPEQMFDVLAISVNGPRAWDLDLAIDVTFEDTATNYRLTLRNGVLVYRKVDADEQTAQATIRLATKVRLSAWQPATPHHRASRSPATRGTDRAGRCAGQARSRVRHRHAVTRSIVASTRGP